jgi:tetratricopeptide (TPR) repeat protein
MDHLTQPLDELQTRAGQFLADREARVLWVVVDEELASPAGGLIEALEWHAENRRAVFELTAGFSVKAPGWGARTEALREAYARQVVAYDQRAIGLPALPPIDQGPAPTHAFATTLAAIARAFSSPDLETEGVMVVLAPGRTAERGALAQALGELAALPALAAVRWIWVESLAPDEPTPADLAPRLGRGACLLPCRIDRAAQKRETDALLGSMLSAVKTGGLPGVARPRMAPPPHPSDPPAGAPVPGAPDAAYLGALLEGIQALRAGKPEDALACLRRARDACLAAGNTADAIDMDLLLGTIGAEVAARRSTPREPVLALLESATKRAEEAGLHAQAAKASLVLGCFARLGKDLERAGKAFMRAAGAAAKAKIPLLQFHALRMAGELALEAGLKPRAQTLWREALDVAAAIPEVEAEATGFRESADQVTAAFKQQGFTVARPGAVGPAAEAI